MSVVESYKVDEFLPCVNLRALAFQALLFEKAISPRRLTGT